MRNRTAPIPDLLELLRQLVRHELRAQRSSALGVVQKVRHKASDSGPENYDCDVKLRDRDLVYYGVPILTSHLGSVATPAEGDVVLLEFVGGDEDQPVVLGRLYNEALRSPDFEAGQLVTRLPPAAGDKERVDLVLTGGENGAREVRLTLPEDVELTVTDATVTVTAGELKLGLDLEAGEALVTTGASTVSLLDDGTMALSGDGDIDISSSGNVNIKASGDLTLEGGGTTVVKGKMVNVN